MTLIKNFTEAILCYSLFRLKLWVSITSSLEALLNTVKMPILRLRFRGAMTCKRQIVLRNLAAKLLPKRIYLCAILKFILCLQLPKITGGKVYTKSLLKQIGQCAYRTVTVKIEKNCINYCFKKCKSTH